MHQAMYVAAKDDAVSDKDCRPASPEGYHGPLSAVIEYPLSEAVNQLNNHTTSNQRRHNSQPTTVCIISTHTKLVLILFDNVEALAKMPTVELNSTSEGLILLGCQRL